MQFTVPMAPAAWARGTGGMGLGPGGMGLGPGGMGLGSGGPGPGPGGTASGGRPSASGLRGAGPVAEKMKDSPKKYTGYEWCS